MFWKTVAVLAVMATSVFGGLTLTWENDAVVGSDDNYTQGLEMMLLGSEKYDGKAGRMTGYGFKNVFYSPEDKSDPNPPPEDQRPWAGYTSVLRNDWKRTRNYTRRTEIMLGVTGEWSQSEEIQTWFHELIGSTKPEGWDNQIPSEPIVNAGVEYYRSLLLLETDPGRLGLEFGGSYGGDAGTAFIDADAALSAKAGWNVPDGMWHGVIRSTRFGGFSLFGFAEERGKLVLHNVTLGGSLFQDGPERELEPLVADTSVGAALILHDVFGYDAGVTYRTVWRTDEFEGQALDTVFGSVLLSFTRMF